MEFAVDQALKTYSGGLGFLAGSHMRAAAALKQNLKDIKGTIGQYNSPKDIFCCMPIK